MTEFVLPHLLSATAGACFELAQAHSVASAVRSQGLPVLDPICEVLHAPFAVILHEHGCLPKGMYHAACQQYHGLGTLVAVMGPAEYCLTDLGTEHYYGAPEMQTQSWLHLPLL